METIVYTRYIKATGDKVNRLKITAYHSIGGYNILTGKKDRAGYYISAMPVYVDNSGGIRCETGRIDQDYRKYMIAANQQSDLGDENIKKYMEDKRFLGTLIIMATHNKHITLEEEI